MVEVPDSTTRYIQSDSGKPTKDLFNWMRTVSDRLPSAGAVTVSGYVNILSFGGMGDGTTANDTAFNNAYASLSSRGGCIYFPAGKYKFTSAISKTLPNAQFSIMLLGDGVDASMLFWPNASGGVTLTAGNLQNTFHIRDLTFSTSQVNSGVGLHLIGAGSNNGNWWQSEIHNVTLAGNDIGPTAPTTQYWTSAIIIHNWGAVDIMNVNTFGPHQTPGSAGGGIGLLIEGDASSTSYVTLVNIDRSSFNYHVIGIDVGDWWQGITLNQTNFNGAVGSGAILYSGPVTATNVDLTIIGCQFNYGGAAQINIGAAMFQLLCANNVITVAGNNNIGLQLDNASIFDNIITGNTFNLFGSPTGTFGIASKGGNTVILGNVFRDTATPVNLEAASTNTGVNLNRYTGAASAANNINSGTGNSLGVISA